MPKLPGQLGCVWEAGSAKPALYGPLEGDYRTETVIVGAGIVGLSTALGLLLNWGGG